MALYIPAAFAVDNRAATLRHLHDHPFATLITPAAPEPWITHIPLLLKDVGDTDATLIGHFARANPHWRHVAGVESIAVFHGPHAYVSPSWYAEPAQAVPTWNFTAVHAHGSLEIFDDVAEVVHFLPGTRPSDLAEGIVRLLDDPALLASRGPRQREWVQAHSWKVLARRLSSMIRALVNDRRHDEFVIATDDAVPDPAGGQRCSPSTTPESAQMS